MADGKKVRCRLVGTNGNAFALMGKWQAAARKQGWTWEEIDAVLKDAKSGDYDHLLAVLSSHCVDAGLAHGGRDMPNPAAERKPYCKPLNAGLASETKSVCRRLARLIEDIDNEINAFVVEGEILDDIRAARLKIMDGLRAEGWTWSYQGTNKLTVREPGHKRPFQRGEN